MFFSQGVRDCGPYGPEISDGRPDPGGTTGVKGRTADKRTGGFQKFLCWPPSGECVGFFCFPGRWNAISKDENLRNENEILTS